MIVYSLIQLQIVVDDIENELPVVIVFENTDAFAARLGGASRKFLIRFTWKPH